MPTPIVHVFRSRGTAATPGYSVFILPWAGVKATGGTYLRAQASTYLGGGILYNDTGAASDYWETDVWLDAGTYKCALIYTKNPEGGIISVQLAGVEKMSVDSYAAAGAQNTYSEQGAIAVTAGLMTLKVICPTKNASASMFRASVNSVALIRTGA